MYYFDTRVRYSETGESMGTSIHSILDYYQDCSAFQSEDGGVGVQWLKNHNRVWVLSSWEIVVNQYPKLGETIRTYTWAYDMKGFYGNRNYKIENQKGEVLSFANSVWVYMDSSSGRPVRIDKEMEVAYPISPMYPYEWTGRKMKIPKEQEEKEAFPVRTLHLDTNHHVNNGQYVNMAQEFLPRDMQISKMKAEYLKSAVLGDMIVPFVSRDGEGYVITLANADKEPYAVIRFEGKRE